MKILAKKGKPVSEKAGAFKEIKSAASSLLEKRDSNLTNEEFAEMRADLGLPPDAANASEGLKALEEILAIAPHTKVIVITGNEDRTNALKAISAGAYDFYQKPIDADVINVIISRALTLSNIESENRSMRAVTDSNIGIIGNSEAIERLRTMVKRIAPTNITTLLLGESGTGKEVAAKAVHLASDRSNKPFVAINCASIPETLLESELSLKNSFHSF